MRMHSGFLLTGCCLDDKQSPIYLQVKAMYTFVYKINVIFVVIQEHDE